MTTPLPDENKLQVIQLVVVRPDSTKERIRVVAPIRWHVGHLTSVTGADGTDHFFDQRGFYDGWGRGVSSLTEEEAKDLALIMQSGRDTLTDEQIVHEEIQRGREAYAECWNTLVKEREAKASLVQRNEDLERKLAERKGWQKCSTHGEINADHQWGCPDCVAQLRNELAAMTALNDQFKTEVMKWTHEVAPAITEKLAASEAKVAELQRPVPGKTHTLVHNQLLRQMEEQIEQYKAQVERLLHINLRYFHTIKDVFDNYDLPAGAEDKLYKLLQSEETEEALKSDAAVESTTQCAHTFDGKKLVPCPICKTGIGVEES